MFAQGNISGTVVDQQIGDPLIGASIFGKGNNYGTICDFEGNFQKFDISPGNYVVISSMIGYQKTSVIGVEVKEGEITKLNIGLSLDAIELEVETVFEVKALRNTDAALLKDRQKTAALSNAISADEI